MEELLTKHVNLDYPIPSHKKLDYYHVSNPLFYLIYMKTTQIFQFLT